LSYPDIADTLFLFNAGMAEHRSAEPAAKLALNKSGGVGNNTVEE